MNARPVAALWTLLIVGMLSAWVFGAPAAAGERKPNVLFIAVDDLNDWIGALDGYAEVKTPNLDRLAKRALVFERAYCAAPACNPSRAALMTGRLPSSSGVYHNNQPWRPVMPDVVTLPQHFRANGYSVAAGGKIYHGGFNDAGSWDEYQRNFGSPEPPGRPLNGIPRAGHFDWGPLDVPDDQMADHKLASWSAERLRQPAEKPFFLGVGFTKPHLPWYVPRAYFDLYPLSSIKLPRTEPNDLDDVPALGKQMARPEGDHRKVLAAGQWEKAVQGYLASISFADAQLGRVLDALEASPHARNTLVVVWGDHGWHLGEKQHWRKFALWEEATRTPLLLAGPGVKAGRVAAPVSLMDLYPTLTDLCGLPARDGVQGASLAPLVRDPQAKWERPALTTHGRGNHALRTLRWRYIRYSDGTEELYDHQADPREWKNLAADPRHAEVKRGLAARLPKTDAPDAPGRRGAAAE